jgi:uncharacterized protein (TIGR00106 family)
MSALTEFAIFPTDKGVSVSEYVSRIIEMIRNSGVSYQLTAMGTIIETESVEDALEIIAKSYQILEPFCERVYLTATMDIRKDKTDAIISKVESIKTKIGAINV